MVSLKQEIKQVLIRRQHKLYERELASKNLTYDEWIRQQEEKLNISTINILSEKRLTNELKSPQNAGGENEDETKKSKKSDFFQIFEVLDESSQYFQGKMTLLCGTASEFIQNGQALLEKSHPDAVVLSVYPGTMSLLAVPLICREFGSHTDTLVVYGDEDTLRDTKAEILQGKFPGKPGQLLESPVNLARENPWFKPDWSPDRFLSSFYFGGLVAVRAENMRKALERSVAETMQKALKASKENKNTAAEQLYVLLFEILKDTCAFEKGHDYRELPVCHIRQVLFHNQKDSYEQIKDLQLPKKMLEEHFQKTSGLYGGKRPLISIIIPSKDNPEALFQCLDSLVEKTRTAWPFEIVLVDNGSSEENKNKISQKIQGLKGQYIYEAMPFNFSKMCNMGAEKAKGEILLFLNDDIEITESGWLDKMAEKAVLPYAGAVGVKLLYPRSDTIQHAGITNLRVGPAHKLQFLSDARVHYFGMNRGVHNMLAATGACLMMRKDVFVEAGGFCERLAVAFNDVDLCYTIFEKGYYNVERNDVILYHHESLSRGNDGDSPEKQLRLLAEKDMLYERHQTIYGKDPFYHPYLTTDMLEQEYSPAYRYQVTLDMPWSDAVPDTGEVKRAREDKCLVVGMECAMDIYKWKYGVSAESAAAQTQADEEKGYYFQGYSFIIGADNACYKKKLLLKNKESSRVWQIPVDNRYRQDIKNNLHDQTNVDLTGFAAKLKKDVLPPGIYQFGMLAEDKCSRLRLVNWSNWVLEVKADE